jgi:transcriptional regulator with XRE-family HTH domain
MTTPLSGREIALARRLAGLSQRELAGRLGISNRLLCELERGRRVIPDGFDARLWAALAGR